MARTVDKLEAFGEMLKEHKVTVADQILFYTACYNHFNQEPDRMTEEQRDEMIRKTYDIVSTMRPNVVTAKNDFAKSVGVDVKNRSHMSTLDRFLKESNLVRIKESSPGGYIKIEGPSNGEAAE